MSQKRARRARASRPQPQEGTPSVRRYRRLLWLAGAVLAAGVLAVAVLAVRPSGAEAPSAALGGDLAPAFEERDVVTGEVVSSASLRGQNTLLFFSEGVMCQACFEQIQALQVNADELRRRGLTLVNITTDPPALLQQAAAAYGITTPLVSDEDRDMSRAYDVLGQGMHPDTAGHTFVLVGSGGKIVWRRDYTTMYVPPQELFAALPQR